MLNVFVFGITGSGKTTLCAAVARFFNRGAGAPFTNIENVEGSRLIREWMLALDRGSFPQKTNRGTFQQIDLGVEHRQLNTRLGVSFLEVAGEDVILLDPVSARFEKPNPTLDAWLDRADAFVLTCSSIPRPEERYILQGFIDVLRQRGDRKPTALVVTAWDLVTAAEDLNKFARTSYTEATNMVKSIGMDGIPTTLISFSIGEVRTEAGSGVIDAIKPESGTEQLVSWLVKAKQYGS